jgi:streptogramin lyase
MKIMALFLVLPAISLAQQIAGTVYNVAIPYKGAANSIAAGPDGALWFPEPPNRIGRITTAGIATSFTLPGGYPEPYGITAGPDGAMWFTSGTDQVGRISMSGAITMFTVPGKHATPASITAGPDGALWFTQLNQDAIGRVTTAGAFTFYPVPDEEGSFGITAGPDGALWFTEASNSIGRITTSGVVSQYPLPITASFPQTITVGPDGALWFTQFSANAIGRITTDGAITEYPLPSGFPDVPYSEPSGITAGPDGALWFVGLCCGDIDRVTTDGVFSYYPVDNTNSGLVAITVGPDGEFWMSSNGGGQIGEAVFVTATLSVSPESGKLGSAVTFTGNGFTPGENVQVFDQGVGSAVLASGAADSTGAFTATGRAPQSPYGPRLFLATGQTSANLGAGNFSMTPQIILDPPAGAAGSTVSVHGSGFSAFQTVSFFWANSSTALGTVMADGYGGFSGKTAFQFTVPASAPPGSDAVSASETIIPWINASATYKVE